VIRATPETFVHVPKGTLHTFQNTGTGVGRLLVTFSPPGAFERFVEEIAESTTQKAPPVLPVGPPDLIVIEKIVTAAQKHGIEIPPPTGHSERCGSRRGPGHKNPGPSSTLIDPTSPKEALVLFDLRHVAPVNANIMAPAVFERASSPLRRGFVSTTSMEIDFGEFVFSVLRLKILQESEVASMPKSKLFTTRLSEEVGGWLERENRRTRLPKSALLETLPEESIRTRHFPGIGFRGPEHSRRAWVIGTGLDVWELVELYEGKGKERLLSEHNVSERQLEVALSYYEMYPREIDEALEENARPPEEWQEISPPVISSPEARSYSVLHKG
jgi:uncharacterized protein (DUF433 family)